MSELKQQLFTAVDVYYTGASITMSVYVDGTAQVLTGVSTTSITLPTQTAYATRRIFLPSNARGYICQPVFSATGFIKHQVISIPIDEFSALQLWHYYEITFAALTANTVTLNMYLDGTIKTTNLTLTSTSLAQETWKVYFPALSFGYIPHITHNYNDTGKIISAIPRVITPDNYGGKRLATHGRVTLQGTCDIEFYKDGTLASTQTLGDGGTSYISKIFRLPGGFRGNVLQWRQTDATLDNGKVALLQFDETVEKNETAVGVVKPGALG